MSQAKYDQLINSPQGLVNGTMRDVILPAILGDETDGILYWIGKDLAREYPVASVDELILLTQQLGLGQLKLIRHNDTQHIWQLSGPIVEQRLADNNPQPASFNLEAGFIAQELEFQLRTVSEAEVTERHKKYVQILAQNDPQSDQQAANTEVTNFIHLKTGDKTDPKSKNNK